jgi:hypothetical protein
VQVKYEMVRRAEAADVPASRAAAGFGFSRQSLYAARAALRERGLAGLVPAKRGPKGGHKLTGQVVDLLEDLLEADPGLRPGAEPGRNAAAASQAGASLSTSTPSPPAPSSKGGDASSPACTSLLPVLSPHATGEIVAVLAQMTLAHALSSAGRCIRNIRKYKALHGNVRWFIFCQIVLRDGIHAR